MIDPSKSAEVDAALQRLFDAVPRAKRASLMREMVAVEVAAKNAFVLARLLNGIRNYILDPESKMGGAESPFVKHINNLVAPE